MPGAYEKVMENRRELVEKIITNMQNGFIFSKNSWDRAAMSPQNPVSRIRYRGGNKLRLMVSAVEHNYQDPRYMTFRQIENNGYKLKAGSKGILCEKWIFEKKVTEKDESGLETEKIVQLDRPMVNYFYVFNGSSVEGLPEYQEREMGRSEIMQIANNFIGASECPIIEVAQDRSYYSPSEDKIVLPLRSSFKDDTAFLSVLLHEESHSTGAKGRLDRDISNLFGTPKYAMEELRAELGSLFVQSDMELKLPDENFNDHTNYLKSWISALKDDPNELFRACADADKISERLIGGYDKYLGKITALPEKKEITL
jgi:antirestriction protein ArdC